MNKNKIIVKTFFVVQVVFHMVVIKLKATTYWNYFLQLKSKIIDFNFVKHTLWWLLSIHYGERLLKLNFIIIKPLNNLYFNMSFFYVLFNNKPNEYIVLV